MNDKLKIAIGTDAFPPTTDGISDVAQSYAEKINQGLGEAVIVTQRIRISRTINIRMRSSAIKAGGFLPKKDTA